MKRPWVFIALLGILLALGCSQSQSIPESKGYVNDFAGMMSKETAQSLEGTLVSYEQQSSNEIAVVTVKSMNGSSVEDYTIRLAEKWKVGKADKDNGVILLVAKEEKRIRIEVGYGLEPVLTDAKSKLIIDRVISPRFSAGDFSGGIQAGTTAIMSTIEGKDVGELSVATASIAGEPSGGLPVWLIFLFIFGGVAGVFFLFVLVAALNATGGGGSTGSGSGGTGIGYWSSGSHSSNISIGNFGGGNFGGGGASGGWR